MCVGAGSSIFIYDPPDSLVDTVAAAADARSVHVYFATASKRPLPAGQWIQLHRREIYVGRRKLLPANLSVFYDLSEELNTATSHLSQRVGRFFPVSCVSFGARDIAQDIASPTLNQDNTEAVRLSQGEDTVAAAVGKTLCAHSHGNVAFVSTDGITESNKPISISTTVDWRFESRSLHGFDPSTQGNCFRRTRLICSCLLDLLDDRGLAG